MLDEILSKNIPYIEKLKLCIEETVVSEQEIKEIITVMAKKINRDYENKKLLMVSILKGAFIFTSDLYREINADIELMFLKASSYGQKAVSSGEVEVTNFPETIDFSQYDVIIVDDILDTGNTLLKLKKVFEDKNAKSVEFCILLDKVAKHEWEIDVKYIGKKIDDWFVVGYGLDYKEKFRNLPYVAKLKEEIYI